MKNIKLHIPELNDYWYEEKLLNDINTMNYNAGYDVDFKGYNYQTGCIEFPKSNWKNKLEKRKSNNMFFAYIVDDTDYVGFVNYQYDLDNNRYNCGVIIEHSKRGNGYSKVGLQLLCEEARKNGIKELYDTFELSREETLNLFLKVGFKIINNITIIKFNSDLKGITVCKKL